MFRCQAAFAIVNPVCLDIRDLTAEKIIGIGHTTQAHGVKGIGTGWG
jgi:hypothetical protein